MRAARFRGRGRLIAGLAICALAAFCASSVRAARFDGPFTVQPIYARGKAIGPAAVHDLDGDGRLDVAVMVHNGIEVMRGTALGELTPGIASAPGMIKIGRTPARLADLDGDGQADFLTHAQRARGLGDGTFEAPVSFYHPNTPSSFPYDSPRVADLNLDGIPDLVRVEDNNKVAVRLGLGGGVLDSVQRFDSFTGARFLAIGIIDGDSYPDLVVSDSFSFEVRLGLGDGDFGSPIAFVNDSAGPPHLSDLDGDGDMDVVTARRVLLGDGAGAFTMRDGPRHEVSAVADWDGDGLPDVAGIHDGSAWWAAGLGNGDFGPTIRVPSGRQPFDLHSGDVDADGRLDLVLMLADGPSVAVVRNRPGVVFAEAPRIASGRAPADVVAVDANRDGIPDLAVANRGERTVSLLIGNGDGTFAAGDRAVTAAGAAVLVAADLDRDGHRDLAVACDSANRVSILPLLAGGHFGTRTDVATGSGPVDLVAADLDEDGWDDLVVSNRLGASIGVIVIDAGGVPSVSALGVPKPFLGPIAVADMNADGHLDVVIGWDDGSWLSGSEPRGGKVIAHGDGQGGFVTGFGWPPLWAWVRAAALAAVDLNGDGRADQIGAVNSVDSAGTSASEVHLWRRDQAGMFQAQYWGATDWIQSYRRATCGRPSGMAFADLDGDGMVEALVSDSSANALFVYAGSASGYVGGVPGIGVAEGPGGIVVSDLNLDGAPDVAVACSAADAVTVLMGAPSPPTSVLISLVSASAGPDGIALRWWMAPGAALLRVERTESGQAWIDLGTVQPDGTGQIAWLDREARAGVRYGYRLRLTGGTGDSWHGVVWMEMPEVAAFSLRGPLTNPSPGAFAVEFSLGSPGPVRVELFDAAGRLEESVELGGLGAGTHTVRLGAARALDAGLHFIRLHAHGRSRSAKAVVVR